MKDKVPVSIVVARRSAQRLVGKLPVIIRSREAKLFRRISHMRRTVGSVVALLLLLSSAGSVNAQTQPGYESAFLEYAQLTKTYDTQKMSELMHPEALRRFRSVFDAAIHGPKAEQAAQSLLPLFSASSAADFAKLTDFQAYKRLNDTVVKSAPELVEMMSTSTYEIVGSFMKNDLAYVTYTLGVTVKGQAVSSQVVQTLKMHDGRWLLMLPSTAEATIAGIEARFH
jgi:hypothetical protein